MAEPIPIERLARPDLERCIDLAVRVRWPREPAKWELLFALGEGYGIAAPGGTLSAMVVLPSLGEASFVAMMAVDPECQGRGLGRRLLEHAMAQATPPLMLYASDQGRPLYERLGFREVDRACKHIGVPRARGPLRGGIRDATDADRHGIADADARAFGVPRAGLIERLLARAERVVVDDRGGFALRWSNGHLAIVGPVVADDEDRAIALVEAALEGCSGKARVDVAGRSTRLAAQVAAVGLQPFGPAPLMTWPSAFLPGDRGRYHALALQAFG